MDTAKALEMVRRHGIQALATVEQGEGSRPDMLHLYVANEVAAKAAEALVGAVPFVHLHYAPKIPHRLRGKLAR